ncbi:atherin-like isoform X2 [Nylanderia fulva]|uniref:atherin-like isoform X2 n=1 Tax=Nylanderia fulva TaxID=613905 RepID=UPI0010FB567C|nr:atherin-like isoform X2 [Nylanderia fulva]XP_029158626.1 atherin-like isoform X2 [Nylanderia fulva]XP_029166229.1 atherin-like isoform X2 [Nylanderia fulva]XP_029173234.1 atherin-like isoform X2 [Nylanderia fulva]
MRASVGMYQPGHTRNRRFWRFRFRSSRPGRPVASRRCLVRIVLSRARVSCRSVGSDVQQRCRDHRTLQEEVKVNEAVRRAVNRERRKRNTRARPAYMYAMAPPYPPTALPTPTYAVYAPPAHAPPVYAPPAYAPPAYAPPAYATPGYAPPAYATPGYATPGYAPPTTYPAATTYPAPAAYAALAPVYPPPGRF